jgi:hypothetical protein
MIRNLRNRLKGHWSVPFFHHPGQKMPKSPTITINRLAIYINSKSAKQRDILHERKYPDPEFNMGQYHSDSRNAISQYLADGADDTNGLHNTIKQLKQSSTPKVGAQRRINSNIDVLEKFLDMLDSVDFAGGEPALGQHSPSKLTVHNVQISVRPEIVLRGAGPKGKKYVGAMKLQLSNSNAFTEEMAGYASAVIQEYCKTFLCSEDEIVHAPYCQIVDVGSKIVFPGVKSTTARLKDVNAACHNIVDLWPSI